MRKLSFLPIWILLLGLTTWYCTKDDLILPDGYADEVVTDRQDAVSAEDILVNQDLNVPYEVEGDLMNVCKVELRTYTQAEWGAEPKGQRVANYLYKGFYTLFGPDGKFGPNWLFIGCKDHGVVFTSPEMVTAYLPIIEHPDDGEMDKRPYPDPDGSVFFGEVTALALNVYFDSGFRDFAPSSMKLKNMVVANTRGQFEGWTVEEVLETANQVLGGCDQTYSVESMQDIVSRINRNYREGHLPGYYLNCPKYDYKELETIENARE